MGHRKKKLMRILIGTLKDKTSIIKANFSTTRSTATAVLRATTHSPAAPPSEHHISAVLSKGNGARQTACSCIGALMDRLNATKNAFVALKCLFTIHAIITRGSFILKDQLSYYPSFGGKNFLNLSKFTDHSDPDTWQFSSWVRWYAAILEHHLMISRFLGRQNLSSSSLSSSTINIKDKDDNVLSLLSVDLVSEIDVLVDFVERICEAPDSLHLQSNSLVYEIVRMVSGDYRLVQQEIFVRVAELGHRMQNLGFDELGRLLGTLKRFEGCRKRLFLVFVNRNRHDALWELIGETKMKILDMMGQIGEVKSLVKMEKMDGSSEWIQFGERFVDMGQLVRVSSDGEWLVWNKLPLTVSTII